MVDAARLRALLSRLESRLHELEPYSATDVDAFITDRQGRLTLAILKLV